jgi:hypothetical protein
VTITFPKKKRIVAPPDIRKGKRIANYINSHSLFLNVYIYQNIMMYTINIHFFTLENKFKRKRNALQSDQTELGVINIFSHAYIFLSLSFQ